MAADLITRSKAQLDEMTSHGPYTDARFYPGTDSPVGCGTNSRYHVTWTISKIGRVSPEQALHSGFSIENRFGEKGNFEVIAPTANGTGFVQYFRENDKEGLPWAGPFPITKVDHKPLDKFESVSLVQADNFGTPGLGDLNMIARIGDRLALFWQEDRGDHLWHGPVFLSGTGFSGNPALIQSRFGEKGNFELLVPQADGNGFAQFWRDNDNASLPWNGPVRIDRTAEGPVGKVDTISLVQADNFGTPGLGDLNAIVRSGDTLKLFWQEDRGKHLWHGPVPLPGTIS